MVRERKQEEASGGLAQGPFGSAQVARGAAAPRGAAPMPRARAPLSPSGDRPPRR
eukprot:CAMPEP_0206002172 /NCGR_PEP_ID=MMETSP1464-20131121/2580_1 /ASSEMBLY_ACC=CAM_ASM_001124 /TAXON_ID=119497 /ORGANISM="Exanthemachrysis gayraliae, Strain RCC1523" /LENGTH=54 /DNA_ID=CAMNT_0053375509 /DNA_START=113 /DNA_END=274 /DNA_ORIENTATION=+